jgi:hypothetical protein
LSLCLIADGVHALVPLSSFLLIWTHSVEKAEWRELWRVEADRLVLTEARVKGSGAGMEPGPGARLMGGWWVWTPSLAVPRIVLGRSGAVGAWRVCALDGNTCTAVPEPAVAQAGEPAVLSTCGDNVD